MAADDNMTMVGQSGRGEQQSPEEANAKRAALIRRLVMLLVFGGAIALGFFVKLPMWDPIRVGSVEESQIREEMAAENRLTILNAMVDGNPDSEKLKELLERLKREKYHGQIEPVELHVERHKNLAEEQQIDREEFAGQLDFYAGGQKLGTLKGETDPVVVGKAIDGYLEGLIERYGADWLPKVGGTARPEGVPGMERTGATGVPGLRRAGPEE